MRRHTRPITRATAEELTAFLTMTIYQVPGAAAAPQVSNSSISKESSPAPSPRAASQTQSSAPVLVPLSIVCEPVDAEIVLDGKSIGRGAISILEVLGSDIHVLVRLQGYEDATLDVKIQSLGGERHEIALQSKTDHSAPVAPPSIP